MFASRAVRPVPVAFPAWGVFALESHHGRGFSMPDERHAYPKLLLPVAGHGWLVRGDVRTRLQQRDIAYIPAGCLHRIEDSPQDPLSLYALCLEPGTLAKFGPLPPALRRHWHFGQPTWGAELRLLLRRILHEQTIPRAGSELLIPSLALQAIVWLLRVASGATQAEGGFSGPTAEARVEAAVRELDHRFYEHVTLDVIAARTGISRRRFTQLFRQITGQSWLEAVRSRRITHARHLLAVTDRSVVSIAFESGFGDLSSFYRTFREAEGVSPLAWRKTHAAAWSDRFGGAYNSTRGG